MTESESEAFLCGYGREMPLFFVNKYKIRYKPRGKVLHILCRMWYSNRINETLGKDGNDGLDDFGH